MSRKVMKLSAFALLIIMLLSSCSKTIQTISPTAEPSETVAETVAAIKTETSIPETTPTPTLSVTPTLTVEPTPPKKEKITYDDIEKFRNLPSYENYRTYEKVAALFGVEGYYIDEGAIREYQWDLEDGKYLYLPVHSNSGFEYLGPAEIETYSVKDTPDFFRLFTSVSYEDCQKIKDGMEYQEVIEILGESNFKEGLASGYTSIEWEVDNGQYFYCKFDNWVDRLENTKVLQCRFLDFSAKTRNDVEKILAERQ